MNQHIAPQKRYAARSIRAIVSFHTLEDGSVEIIAAGRNGALSLQIDGGDPTMSIPNLALGPGKYRAVWSLQANGHLRGWLVDKEGHIEWFPKRAARKPKKKQAQAKRRSQGRQG